MFDVDTKMITNKDFDIIAKMVELEKVDDMFGELTVRDLSG